MSSASSADNAGSADEIRISYPDVPTSLNAYYRHRGNRTYITKEGKAFKKAFQAQVKNQGGFCFCGPIEVYIWVTVPNRKAHDLDNFFKALLDSLESWVFTNDQYIVKLVAEKDCIKDQRQTEIVVKAAKGKTHLFTDNVR